MPSCLSAQPHEQLEGAEDVGRDSMQGGAGETDRMIAGDSDSDESGTPLPGVTLPRPFPCSWR